MPRQDLSIKTDPYSATYVGVEFLRDATCQAYSVLSASGGAPYETLIADNPDYDRCSCQAARRCWHKDAARLRQAIDRMTRASESFYATWLLPELQDEDQRLRTLLAEADSWLVRSQWNVVGDYIGALLQKQEAA